MSFPDIQKLLRNVDAILLEKGSRDEALLAIAQLLSEKVEHYNWVGFYIANKDEPMLHLGPYVGAPTDHTDIPFGKGVCGQVAESGDALVIQDVNAESNYLSCSIDVKSEVVFPINKDGKFVAQLDIDSHALSPFGDEDTELLETICQRLEKLF